MSIIAFVGAATTRKHAKGSPQKYQYKNEPVPIHLRIGTFGVNGTYGCLRLSIGTEW